MNVRLEGRTDREAVVVAGTGVVVDVTRSEPERAPTGGPVPPWDIVHIELPSGVVGLGFQIVASPRGERPVVSLARGATVRVEAALHWHAAAVIRDEHGRSLVGAGFLAGMERAFGGVGIETGPLGRQVASTWHHDARVTFDGLELEVPCDGWHRFETPLGGYDVAALSLRAELPSAMMSHRRFAIVARA